MTTHHEETRLAARITAVLCATLTALLMSATPATATDLQLSTDRPERVAGAQAYRVPVRVTWANAWRNERNYDAIWLFAKVRPRAGASWRHARLRAAQTRTAQPRLACDLAADRIGAFCAPAESHRGSVTATILLEVDVTGLPPGAIDSGTVEVQAIGIEMVFVPAGPFTLGDPDSASVRRSAYYRSDASGGYAGTYRVTTEAGIPVGPHDGALYYRTFGEYDGDRGGPIPQSFPKGTRAFYIMKYELSQGTYASFLNLISPDASGFRAINAVVGYAANRGTIELVNGTFVARSPDRPANFVSWDDGTAFADWAGLRPMTDFEFTKAARGPAEPIAGDYPWGTNSKVRLLRRVGADGELNRAGEAAEDRLTDGTRDILGASYWWVMDLAGSVWEKVVSAGHPTGRSFRGTHGDGELRNYGRATNPDWPSGDDDGGGYGYRGGGHYTWAQESTRDPLAQSLNPHSPVAWRPFGGWGGGPRSVAYGFRAVRSVDAGVSSGAEATHVQGTLAADRDGFDALRSTISRASTKGTPRSSCAAFAPMSYFALPR